MAKGGSKGGDGGAMRAANQGEFDRQNAIRNGTTSINHIFDGQFDDKFFEGRRKAFTDYANPQLADQYADARKELTYSLDRSGLLDSTARTGQEAKLSKLYDTNQRAVSDQALGYENTARNNVNASRSNLLGNLAATGDVSSAVNSANSNAASLTQPDVYSPLSQLFSTFTNGLSTQAQLEKSGAIGGGKFGAAYPTGIFAPKPGKSVETY